MSTVTVQQPPPIEPLLDLIQKLDMDGLSRVIHTAKSVQNSYREMRERELLAQIYAVELPEGVYERCERLTNRLDERGELTPAEQDEMGILIDQIEMTHVERLALVIELAKLKQLDLKTVIASIKERDDLPPIDFPPRQHG